MSYALIAHRETNNTDAGALASSGSATTFRTRKLTDILVNQQFSTGVDTVYDFRNSSDANPSQFDLIAGVYRIYAEMSFSQTQALYQGHSVRVGLYNITDSRFEYYYGGGTEPIIGTSGVIRSSNAIPANGYAIIDAQFTVSGGTKTYEIRQAVWSNTVGVSTTANSAGVKGNVTTGSHKEVYGLIRIQKIS